MNQYIILLRGVNVGGKNKVPMAVLRSSLEAAGFFDVITYIQSGNVLLRTTLDAPAVRSAVEMLLRSSFTLEEGGVKALVLTQSQLNGVVAHKPDGFGEEPTVYLDDVIFLIDITAEDVQGVFRPREGVDQIWLGDGVVYSRRLSELRTKSRLSAAISTPEYKSMTIRNWNTVMALLDRSDALAAD